MLLPMRAVCQRHPSCAIYGLRSSDLGTAARVEYSNVRTFFLYHLPVLIAHIIPTCPQSSYLPLIFRLGYYLALAGGVDVALEGFSPLERMAEVAAPHRRHGVLQSQVGRHGSCAVEMTKLFGRSWWKLYDVVLGGL